MGARVGKEVGSPETKPSWFSGKGQPSASFPSLYLGTAVDPLYCQHWTLSFLFTTLMSFFLAHGSQEIRQYKPRGYRDTQLQGR